MTKTMSNMKDMRRSQEEKMEQLGSSFPSPNSISDYPYGLCISLTNEELEKLDMSHEELKPGDMLHLHALAKVTSVSSNASEEQEPHCRVELQITHIDAENEDKENEEAEEEVEEKKSNKADKYAKLYGK